MVCRKDGLVDVCIRKIITKRSLSISEVFISKLRVFLVGKLFLKI